MNNNNFYLWRYLFLFLLFNINIYSQKYGIDTVIVKSTCPCTFTTNYSINPQVVIDTIIVTDSKRIDLPPLPIYGFKSLENIIEYPEIFKRAKIEGVILLEAIINENGTLDSIKTIRDQTCCSAAEETTIKLKSHKFIPAYYKKKSISVKVNIPVNFYLNEKVIIDYKPINGITEISMERTRCYGSCPSYKVVYKNDGTAIFIGISNVPMIGTFTAKFGKEEFERLARLIESNCFFDFNDSYGGYANDAPETIVVAIKDDIKKSVVNRIGVHCPIGLWGIELVLDYFPNRLNWQKIEE